MYVCTYLFLQMKTYGCLSVYAHVDARDQPWVFLRTCQSLFFGDIFLSSLELNTQARLAYQWSTCLLTPRFWDCKFILPYPVLQTKKIKKNKQRKKIQFWDLNHGPSAQKSLTIWDISTVPREVILKSFTVFFFLKDRKPYTQAGLELMVSQPQSTPLPVACQCLCYSHQPV